MKKEVAKPIYMLCPRCELNYIESQEKYCNVCKAELGLMDATILIPDDEGDMCLEKFCPVCKVNYIGEDEEICFLCQKERTAVEPEEDDENWMKLLDEDDTLPPEEISLELVAEEEEAEDEAEQGEKYTDPNDFDYDIDPSDFEDDGFDDEDDDDDDEVEDDD